VHLSALCSNCLDLRLETAHRNGYNLASSQVEAVREEIYRMLQRDPAAKVLIFSQFTSMLDILHYRLTQVCAS
jgi:SNF2 family DNA or RNA helicase